MTTASLPKINQSIKAIEDSIGERFSVADFQDRSVEELDEIVASAVVLPPSPEASETDIDEAVRRIREKAGEAPDREELEGITKRDLESLVESIVNPAPPQLEQESRLATTAEITTAVQQLIGILEEDGVELPEDDKPKEEDFAGINKLDLDRATIDARISQAISKLEKQNKIQEMKDEMSSPFIGEKMLENGDAFMMIPDGASEADPQLHVLLMKLQQLQIGAAINIKTGVPTVITGVHKVNKIDGVPGLILLPMVASPVLPLPEFPVNPQGPGPLPNEPPWPKNEIKDGTDAFSVLKVIDPKFIKDIYGPPEKDLTIPLDAPPGLIDAAVKEIKKETGEDVSGEDFDGITEDDLRAVVRDVTGKDFDYVDTIGHRKGTLYSHRILKKRTIKMEIRLARFQEADSSIKGPKDLTGRAALFFVKGYPVGTGKVGKVAVDLTTGHAMVEVTAENIAPIPYAPLNNKNEPVGPPYPVELAITKRLLRPGEAL